jgi:hypothetical protein
MKIEFYRAHKKIGTIDAHGSQLSMIDCEDDLKKTLYMGIAPKPGPKLYPDAGEAFAQACLDVYRSPYLRAVLVN